MGLRLIIEDYDGETTVVPLNGDEGTVTVGRQESNTIQLTEQNVSRRHAKFNFDGHHWLVEDLSSYNGVRVNGRQVPASTQLDEGDVVQIGDYRLILGSDVKAGDHQVNTQRNRAANDDTVIGLSTKTAIVPGEPTRNLTVEQVPTSITTEVRSTASPRVTAPLNDIVEDPEPKKRGLWVVIVALIALVSIAGVALMTSGSNEPSASAETKAALQPSAEPPRSTPTPVKQPSAAPAEQLPSAEPAAQATPTANETSKESAGSADPSNSADASKAQAKPSEGAVPSEPDPSAQDLPTPGAANSPAGSTPSVDELAADPIDASGKPQRNPARAAAELRQAQEASFAQDFEKARDLARRSYEHNFSADALRILGLSACKLGSRKDARWAFDKLRLNFRSERAEQIRSDLQQVCASHGINLGP